MAKAKITGRLSCLLNVTIPLSRELRRCAGGGQRWSGASLCSLEIHMCLLKRWRQISACSVGNAAIIDVLVNVLPSLGTYQGSLRFNSGTSTSVMSVMVDVRLYCAPARCLTDSFTTKHMTACKKGPDLDPGTLQAPCRHPAGTLQRWSWQGSQTGHCAEKSGEACLVLRETCQTSKCLWYSKWEPATVRRYSM